MESIFVMNFVNATKGCKFIELTHKSECKMPKGLGLDGVYKIVSGNYQFNYCYENAVNNRVEKQGGERTFKTGHLIWGKWSIFDKVLTHKGVDYLRYYLHKGTIESVTYYEKDGTECSAERIALINEYLKSKGKPLIGTQAAVGLVDNQVEPKNVAFGNIMRIKCDGVEYTDGMVVLPIVAE